MKLTKVNMAADRYFHKFKLVNTSIIKVEIDKTNFDSLSSKEIPPPILAQAIYISSLAEVCFETPTGYFENGQYATQINGFHWVKIAGYEMTKINPEYIVSDNLSSDGMKRIKYQAVEV